MNIQEISIDEIDISDFNVRKNLVDGQQDSNITDLANSIENHGLLSPITVFRKSDGRFGLVAGQRRLLACKQLGRTTISAIERDSLSKADATAISLVENVHRADMNPHDKAVAFNALLEKFGDVQAVSRETGVGASTIRKYIQLLNLAPELQERLAGGEAKNTQALAKLAQQIEDPEKQTQVWDQIKGFTQNVQEAIIKRVEPNNLDNLRELVNQSIEGAFSAQTVRDCPFDCPTIPEGLKRQVAQMIEAYSVREEVRRALD